MALHGGPARIGAQRLQRGRGEAFGLHAVFRHTGFQQRGFGGLDHGFGAADEHFVHAPGGQQRGHDGAHLVRVDAPLQKVDFLRLT